MIPLLIAKFAIELLYIPFVLEYELIMLPFLA